MIHTFTPSPGNVSRDTLMLKHQVGGESGEIHVGLQKISVLKVKENLYVTEAHVPIAISTALELGGADIHRMKSPADYVQFVERMKEFDHG